MKAILLGTCTLLMMIAGLGVVFLVAFIPTIEFLLLLSSSSQLSSVLWILAIIACQTLHLWLLWISTIYFYIFRTLVWPIRKLVMPIAMLVVRMGAQREGCPILFLDLATIEQLHHQEPDVTKHLLLFFRPSVRRRYKKMQETYRTRRIQCKSYQSETQMNLSKIVPIMWKHEKRCCQQDGKSVVEEFLKRFLVMTLSTNAVLDLYFCPQEEEEGNARGDQNKQKLVCVQLSVQQHNVLHWFMYFSTELRSGIWYHGILNSMVRGMKMPNVRYINAQLHQTQSKEGAGLVSVDPNSDSASDLYPLAFSENVPKDSLQTMLWEGLQTTASPSSLSRNVAVAEEPLSETDRLIVTQNRKH